MELKFDNVTGKVSPFQACQRANLFEAQLLLLATLQVDYPEAGELVGDHFGVGGSDDKRHLERAKRAVC